MLALQAWHLGLQLFFKIQNRNHILNYFWVQQLQMIKESLDQVNNSHEANSSDIANNYRHDQNNQNTIPNNKTQIPNNKTQDSKIKKNNNQKHVPINKAPSNQSSSSQSTNKPPCINKICPKLKNSNLKTHQNKTFAFDPEDLCNQCMVQYKKQAFCLYCKQIYFDSSDDGKEWILCDECGRWVHSQCANYEPSVDSQFKCIKCKKNEPTQNLNVLVKKQSVKTNTKQVDRRKQLAECSLNAYGFYWQLGAKQLAEDMDKIRQFLH